MLALLRLRRDWPTIRVESVVLAVEHDGACRGLLRDHVGRLHTHAPGRHAELSLGGGFRLPLGLSVRVRVGLGLRMCLRLLVGLLILHAVLLLHDSSRGLIQHVKVHHTPVGKGHLLDGLWSRVKCLRMLEMGRMLV